MHVHLLGIAGTFMASLALLAKQLGFKVTGQDQNIYPPMSTQLANAQIDFTESYDIANLPIQPDLIIIGNVMRRGMPIIEHILDNGLPFMSGPEFLAKFILKQQHVLVVSGTHGKTTTTSMLAWILQYAGLNPGYLIGGVAKNFICSANLGDGNFFVIEGDEYDCAFFDKRSKFIHYRPKTLIINNIEFDHADIFPDLQSIILQFHYLLRLIPSSGIIIFNQQDNNIEKLLNMGSWSKLQEFSLKVNVKNNIYNNLIKNLYNKLPLSGDHNISNALAACIAAINIGLTEEIVVNAMQQFKGVVRRLEYKGCHRGINIYDDFAHHPTAIKVTVNALAAIIQKNQHGQHNSKPHKIIAVVDLGSNTLKMGVNNKDLITAVKYVDQLYLYAELNKITWDIAGFFKQLHKPGKICSNLDDLIRTLNNQLQDGDYLLFMSNGSLAKASDSLVAMLDN